MSGKMIVNLALMAAACAAIYFAFMALHASAEERGSAAVYDKSGHYSGSIVNNGNGTTSQYDGAGRFTGSTINQGSSTSVYDGAGRFQGTIHRRR